MSHASRAFALEHMPVDVIDFASHWPDVRGDLATTLATALLKEPVATRAMRTSVLAAAQDPGGEGASAETLAEAFAAVVRAVDGAPHRTELQTLSRQGPAVGVRER